MSTKIIKLTDEHGRVHRFPSGFAPGSLYYESKNDGVDGTQIEAPAGCMWVRETPEEIDRLLAGDDPAAQPPTMAPSGMPMIDCSRYQSSVDPVSQSAQPADELVRELVEALTAAVDCGGCAPPLPPAASPVLTDAQQPAAPGVVEALEAAAKIPERRAQDMRQHCQRDAHDPSTGVWECELEARGRDCLCAAAMEEAEGIAQDIRALSVKQPDGATARNDTMCKARRSSGATAVDCEWPLCDCDPAAVKVIAALEEMGALSQPAQAQQPAASVPAWCPNDIRSAGWAVAVHNDYRLYGEPHTFWLFTHGDKAVKGEGRTDAEALNQVRALLGLTASPPPPAAAAEGWRPISEAPPGEGGLLLGNRNGVYGHDVPEQWVCGYVDDNGKAWDIEGYPLTATHFIRVPYPPLPPAEGEG